MISSKTIRIRYVEESDAEFILKLRLDERYNQFLSQVNGDLESHPTTDNNDAEDRHTKPLTLQWLA